MDREKKVYPEDQDLTEADRTILRLYEQSVEPIEWDESDAAILAYAHSIHAKSEGDSGAVESTAKMDQIAATEEPLEEDRSGEVVAFKPRQRPMSGQAFYRSPLAGLSIAASLMIGVFAGQGLTPYVNFGLAPDYDKIIEEDQQLTSGLSKTRSIRIREREATDGSVPSAADSGLNRIGTILNGFTCANLTMTLLREGEVRVSGHLSSPGDLDVLRSSLAKIPQLGRVVEDIRIYGWPTCEALQVLGKGTIVGAGAGGGGPEVRPFDHGPVYVGGESLVVEARGPELYDSYLYVDFVQNDGNVVHLLPFDQRMENKVKPDQKILLGNADIQYELAPPFGTELLVVIASPVPIFEEPRVESEPARDYFRALEQALEKLAAEGHGDKVMSAYRVLTTKAE